MEDARAALVREIRAETQCRCGKYVMSHLHTLPGSTYLSHKQTVVHVIYIPSKQLKSASFSFDTIFAEVGVKKCPELVFQLNKAVSVAKWNMKMDGEHRGSVLRRGVEPTQRIDEEQLDHCNAILEGNCQRLFAAIGKACVAANAVYRCNGLWHPRIPVDYVGRWARAAEGVPMLAVVGLSSIDTSFLRTLWGRMYNTNDTRNDSELPVMIDIRKYTTKSKGESKAPEEPSEQHFIPHIDATVVFLTDDYELLDKKLRDTIPYGLIIVNGGKSTCDAFAEATANKSPIFIFKSTGGFADLSGAFLRSARASANYSIPFKVNNLQPGSFPDSSNPDESNWLRPFKENDGLLQCAKRLNVIAHNSSSSNLDYYRHNVQEIDIFGTSQDKIQDRITKTMSLAFTGKMEIGGQKSDEERLAYAWKLRYLLLYNSRLQQVRADNLWFRIVLGTLASTALPVVQVYCEIEEPSAYKGSNREGLFYLVMLFPFVTSFLRALFAFLTPQVKADILGTAALQTEYNIYSYRTKTGEYSNVRKAPPPKDKAKRSESTDEKASATTEMKPSKLFSKRLSEIWLSLSVQTIQKDGVFPPPASDNIYADIDEMISEDAHNSKISLYRMDDLDTDKDLLDETAFGVEGLQDNGLLFGPGAPHQLNDGIEIAGNAIHSVARRVSVIASDVKAHMADGLEAVAARLPTHNRHTDHERQSRIGTESSDVEAVDNNEGYVHLTTMMADEYIRYRLRPKLTTYDNAAPQLSHNVTYSGFGVMVLSVLASLFTPVDQTVWIPVVLAVSAALSSWTTHKGDQIKLSKTNFAIGQLNALLVWWEGLNVIEKRTTSNKENLVQSAESIFLAAELPEGNSADKDSSEAELESDGVGDKG